MRQYTTLGFILYYPKESNGDKSFDNVNCVMAMENFPFKNAQQSRIMEYLLSSI